MSLTQFLPYLLVMAAVTYLVRAVPYVLIRKKIENRFIKSFMAYIPYAVLSSMTVPAILYSTTYFWSAFAGFIVAMVMAYFDKGLFTVAIGSCSAVFIIELFIRYIL